MPRTNPGRICVGVVASLATVALALASGCGTTKTSGTARTGTEQLLLTNAWDSALQKVDFRPLTGVPVYLDTTNVTAVDQGWVVSSLRQALLSQGVLIRTKPEDAQWVVEARVGAYGTDDDNWLLGVPQVTMPPTVTGVPTGTIPKIPIMEKTNQSGVAKLALFAYDRASGQIVWNSGTVLAKATAKDVYIGGMGPFQSGSIRDGTEIAGVRIPTATEPPARRRRRSRASDERSTLKMPAGSSDLDSFAP